MVFCFLLLSLSLLYLCGASIKRQVDGGEDSRNEVERRVRGKQKDGMPIHSHPNEG